MEGAALVVLKVRTSGRKKSERLMSGSGTRFRSIVSHFSVEAGAKRNRRSPFVDIKADRPQHRPNYELSKKRRRVFHAHFKKQRFLRGKSRSEKKSILFIMFDPLSGPRRRRTLLTR